ncbi:MAG: hydroxymethylglutaryl-CoA synthase [Candidatus Diapherotrites archaeon]|jgi:hydroxymethylglutaryl-CoA synthase|uniref:Hydroxymethylglutaryl-CoA synthase n=1 Tax=Candidatus Iainarchaeum sp. TaxID=3101447 RepID=A0A8T5GG80_9ARCH|nr:hydroxymethylglutaryl-CoA synthase [Candidatus Diapherotrites archaeon]MBT7241133.1 hydroxymethylglutaryl-CoA synthase [Candidatus Diapherotrites archaeon]
MAGIIGYGAYIPKYRVSAEEIAAVQEANANAIKRGLGLTEKSVPGKDEDTITIATHAARDALARAGINKKDIGAIYVGSESHPYAVKPSSAIVAEAIGIGNDYTAVDTEFACKAGSATIQINAGLVDSKMVKYGVSIGADTSQAEPGNALEYSAAAGGAAFIIGSNKESLAIIDKTVSFTSDTPDFWRRSMQAYPSHAGRFTGEPAYFKHVIGATKLLLEKTKTKIEDYTYVVFHMPNGKFPRAVAKIFKVTEEQLVPGLVVEKIGNTYSGSSLLGLAAVLDIAKPGDKILMTSYGSGSGSDSFALTVTEKITEAQGKARTTQDYIDRKEYLSYAKYLKHMETIH